MNAAAIPLDALTTIFIFLIGLPALLLQTLAPELLEIVRKRRTQLAFFTIFPIAFAGAVVIAGVWFSKWCTEQRLTESGRYPFLKRLLEGEGELLWVLILLLLVIISGMTAIFLTHQWRREAVIQSLENRATRSLSRRARLVETQLTSLIQLGKQSAAGKDKDLVLQALASLVSAVQAHERYEGRQLEVIILGLEDILLLGPQKGSSENFRTSADLLSELVISATKPRYSEDLRLAVRAISALARTSLPHQPSHIQMRFVDALDLLNAGKNAATWMSEALFEIGSHAAKENQILVAMAALSKLDALGRRLPRLEGEVAYDYLGLIAHLWVKGETARGYVTKMLDEARHLFVPPLLEAMRAAQAHCLLTAKFETSDHLAALLQAVPVAAVHERL
jgi:hypothetical protein